MNKMVKKLITAEKSIAPLAVFRVLFGFIMAISILRFVLNGWIYEQYIRPSYYFTYYGFDWVQPLGEIGMYALFFVMGLSAIAIMVGYRYRIATLLFFLSFTYVELIDKTNYLNHYYFVSIISFLLILVPANRSFSLDVLRKPDLKVDTVPAWTVNIFKLQLILVYVFAGVAKLNYDWLLEAMPLRLWLPAHAHLPLIGSLLELPETAYLFSWAGAFYDLTIAFFLLYKPTRVLAYGTVIAFHLMTALLFQIGMFPFIMILSTLIFFSPEFHERVIRVSKKYWQGLITTGSAKNRPQSNSSSQSLHHYRPGKQYTLIVTVVLILHFLLQLLLPLRYSLYPGNLFWTEQGYRFSWRVMLMEKAGNATFKVKNPETGRLWEVSNWKHLTPVQEKMMATQPDMILQFAHHMEEIYMEQGIRDVEINAEIYVTLNGRKSTLLIDPIIDLTKMERGFKHKEWILPRHDTQESWIQTVHR